MAGNGRPRHRQAADFRFVDADGQCQLAAASRKARYRPRPDALRVASDDRFRLTAAGRVYDPNVSSGVELTFNFADSGRPIHSQNQTFIVGRRQGRPERLL